MTVAGIIVTYNRKELLIQNLDALIKQTKKLDSVIIIDNASTDGTKDTLVEKGYFDMLPIDYVLMESNSGGAGGFSFGVEYGYKKGFDFLILMDDDGKPYDSKTVENIYSKATELYSNQSKLLVLNSLVTYDGINTSFGMPYNKEEIFKARKKGDILIDAASAFNGTLISKQLIEKIGIPRKDFFISCDEREYINRAKKNGAFIATVTTSIYHHPQSRDTVMRVGKRYYETFSTPFKEYYYTRNSMCINKSLKNTVKILIDRLYAVTHFEDKKAKRYYYCFKATFDSTFNLMGKRI